MANTNRAAGKDLYVEFGGQDISGDFTSVSVSVEDDQIDVTAGADTYHYHLSLGRTNGSMDYEAFYDSAATGSAVWNAIVPGAAGTLIVGPLGTASGKPKWTYNRALVTNRDSEHPFDEAITVSASFAISAAMTETTY